MQSLTTLLAKARPGGKRGFVRYMVSWPRLARYAVMVRVKAQVPRGKPERKSRLRPPRNPQMIPSRAPLSKLQETTTSNMRWSRAPPNEKLNSTEDWITATASRSGRTM